MSKQNKVNHADSVYAKLLNISRQKSWSFMLLLVRYATERFLYRLSKSSYADQFVLKGGNMFIIWQNGDNSRPTIDSDLLCFGNATPDHLREVFTAAALSNASPEDGMRYNVNSMQISSMREDSEYGGSRIAMLAYLKNAKINLRFDIGVGDIITPGPEMADFPVLLDSPVPRLKVYPMPTVIAEKTESMISREFYNSRMKDFFDLWLLANCFEHNYAILCLAIRNTFARRKVAWPEKMPVAFTGIFANNAGKILQWKAFLRKNKMLFAPADFPLVMARISDFLSPIFVPPAVPVTVWTPEKGWK